MKPTEGLQRYLDAYRLRLQQLTTARGLAVIAGFALVVTLAAVFVAIRSGFPGDLMLTARLMLLFGIAGLAAYFIVLPNRRLREAGSAG